MPRPFRFGLQKILDVREQLEEQAKIKLSKAQAFYMEKVRAVERLRETLTEHEASLYKEERLSAADIWLWRNYKERLLLDVARAESAMLEAAKELNRCRREAVLKAKERKLLEKLKEKQAIRHAEDEKLKEQKEFDEMATLRYQPGSL
jgi:flagellar protein FliJ